MDVPRPRPQMIELLCLATTVAGGGCDASSLAPKKMTGSGLSCTRGGQPSLAAVIQHCFSNCSIV
jgi:hypothetical protein